MKILLRLDPYDKRVNRGGWHGLIPAVMREAHSAWNSPHTQYNDLGFRPVVGVR